MYTKIEAPWALLTKSYDKTNTVYRALRLSLLSSFGSKEEEKEVPVKQLFLSSVAITFVVLEPLL